MHKRILIVGSSGAGKSTLARQLGEATALPIVHLDSLYWQPGWIGTEKPIFKKKLMVELQKHAWIIDGNFDSTLALRAQYADLIIMLDYDKKLCLYRAMKRYITHFGKTRADMAPGCPEKMDIEFMKWIWTFPKEPRQNVLDVLSSSSVDSIILKSPRQLQKWLSDYVKRFR